MIKGLSRKSENALTPYAALIEFSKIRTDIETSSPAEILTRSIRIREFSRQFK